MAKVSVGQEAPAFELPGTSGRAYRLADYAETGVILAFYPGDFTPVCTKQFCSYRDDGDRIEALGLPMLGISPQDVESHERFIEQHGLTVPLLYDQGKRVARSYGVLGPGGFVRRAIFLVGPGGIVRYRHVALFGLRYQDVGDLERAVASVSGSG
jgi:peroxiredoxin Q/BCP